ncbi:MAG: SPOR domain-containing protein [Gammaproteobacteria bacterium]|nr:SPOR domain-containing protein [Gammaproteobacteria bacterium]
MDDQLKQRLVGAAVIISLGIIFLPSILDGGRYTEFEKIRIEIPPQPEVDFSSSIAPLAPPQVRMPGSVDTDKAPDSDAIEAEGRTSILDDELAEIIKPIESPEEIVGQQGTDLRKSEVKKPEKPVEPRKPVKPKVVAKTAPPPPLPGPSMVTAWVVQVGSFSSRESAISLRNRIRKQGFAAFVESFDKNGKPSHRVRVGPETTRSRSENTLTALKKKMQLEGIVVTYP